jgi:hypothetical protein
MKLDLALELGRDPNEVRKPNGSMEFMEFGGGATLDAGDSDHLGVILGA